MIELKIHNSGEDNIQRIAFVEIFPGKCHNSTWEKTLEELEDLAKSGKDTVFRINYYDDDGVVSTLIRLWLQNTDTILVETSIPWIRKALKLAHGEKVIFID